MDGHKLKVDLEYKVRPFPPHEEDVDFSNPGSLSPTDSKATLKQFDTDPRDFQHLTKGTSLGDLELSSAVILNRRLSNVCFHPHRRLKKRQVFSFGLNMLSISSCQATQVYR